MKTSNAIAIRIFSSVVLLLMASACQTIMTNMAPAKIPENPSNIYTFSFNTQFKRNTVKKESIEAFIVINGSRYTMRASDLGSEIFEYDYKMPPGVTEVAYYYMLEYDYLDSGEPNHAQEFSEVFKAQLVNRYVIQLESNRAPVGSRVAVVGRGFSPYDVVVFDSTEVPTEFSSQNTLSFVVPSLPAGRDYGVSLKTGQGDIVIGDFRIDQGSLTAFIEKSTLSPGERTYIIFKIGFEAPPGGLYVDVTTDVPASVIMPEVVIHEGTQSVSVPVDAGEPGSGSIFAEVPGFAPVELSIAVY